MATEQAISLEDINEAIRRKADTLPKTGRIEIVIYKSNHALRNYEIRTTESHEGAITLNQQ